MTQFCREFCGRCDRCREALAEIDRESKAWAEAVKADAKNPGGGRFALGYRTTLEQAALDHRGRP